MKVVFTGFLRQLTFICILIFSFLLFPFVLEAQELYWEEPQIMVPDSARFPRVVHNQNQTAVIWHEFEYRNGEPYQTSISLMLRRENGEWDLRRKAVGPFNFVGDEVPYASAAPAEDGTLLLAVASSGLRIELYSVEGADAPIQRVATVGSVEAEGISVSPRLFSKQDGGFLLFATQPLGIESREQAALTGSLGINYAVSENGREWSRFQPLVERNQISYIYLPSHSSYRGREYVVFQGSPPESRYYQLFLVSSADGGRSWSSPQRITSFSDSLGGAAGSAGGADNFDNQRPFLSSNNEGLHLTWERKFSTVTNPQIYYGMLAPSGEFREQPERITSGNDVCRSPQVSFRDNKPVLTWFDNRKGGNRVFAATLEGIGWQTSDLSIMPGESLYGSLFEVNGKLNAVWENKLNDQSRLVLLEPDQSVQAPAVIPVNFRADGRSSQSNYSVRWSVPEDSSGIAGFNFTVDRNPDGRPDEEMQVLRRDERLAEVEVKRDGQWYFHVIARDYAGNWSDARTIPFFRDTTPPAPVEFTEIDEGEDGYLPSNTYSIEWNPPEDEDVAGYSYRLQYLSGPDYQGDLASFSIQPPPERTLTRDESYSFVNLDNGTWALTVAAVDTVGNVGPARTQFFRLNKYIPVTYITRVEAEQDQMNRYELQLIGRGFSVGGEIQEVMLDRDGEAPYDYVYRLENNLFTVRNDRLISGPSIDQIDEGAYRVGLVHPTRGTYFTNYTLQFETTGVVKFGDFTLIGMEKAPLRRDRVLFIQGGNASLVLIMILLLAALLFAGWKITALAKEGLQLRNDVRDILENRKLSYETKKEKLAAMEKRGIGLRVKFALLTTMLVLIIVVMVAVPLGNYMIQTQQKNLTQGLQESTRVLIESLNAGAEKFLPEESSIELGRLPRQSRAAEDAQFVTITGPPSSSAGGVDPDFFDYLWASNDPEIQQKVLQQESGDVIQSGEFTFQRGNLKVEDRVSEIIPDLKQEINTEAQERVGRLSERLSELQREAREVTQRLVTSQNQDIAQLLTELQDQIAQLNTSIEEELAQIGDRLGSVPDFKSENILTGPQEYIFYRPIVYQDSSREGVYYHGMIRLGISTERIVQEILSSRDTLIRQTAIIAFIAIGLGILGALLLATIILIPIRRLVRGVEKIRDTEDKEELKNHEIDVKTRDEIAALADTVNQMTKGLVNAAVANKDLIIGKEIQKMFIPLEENSRGRKLTTGSLSTEGAEFFGYYEGAKGVSGDYFDFMEITPGKYGVIKCDVAGKGVAASLIMVEVATIFRNYFNEWVAAQKRKDELAAQKGVKRPEEDPNLEELVYAINRLVQERGFPGRFAALIVVLVDTRNGKTIMCNAGDNLVHLFNNEKRAMETKTLPEAPAAGVFPNDLVEMQSGFKRIPHMLKTNDILLLFTDGLEESQRHFRDDNFEITTCQESGIAENELHDNHALGTDNEEFGIPRVYGVVNALFARSTYQLYKHHNPVEGEELVFDFSDCTGTIEETVITLMAVEKVFRMYPDPSANENDVVVVDRKVDAFLKKHFLQYANYFHHPLEITEDQEEYIRFSHVKEDSQYDDLTILGVRKK